MTIAEQLRQEGIQQGIRQWIQQGEVQGQRKLLFRQLTAKFGKLDPDVLERVEQADVPTLDRLAEKVLTASSLTDVFDD